VLRTVGTFHHTTLQTYNSGITVKIKSKCVAGIYPRPARFAGFETGGKSGYSLQYSDDLRARSSNCWPGTPQSGPSRGIPQVRIVVPTAPEQKRRNGNREGDNSFADYLIGEAILAVEFERARLPHHSARVLPRSFGLGDHPEPYTPTSQAQREVKAGRACSYNQNR
jgi:hypothetical protein